MRCAVNEGSFQNPASQIGTLSAATARNGTPRPNSVASVSPSGKPTTEATANADVTVPIARPRRASGKTSAMIAIMAALAIPPQAPASARVATSVP